MCKINHRISMLSFDGDIIAQSGSSATGRIVGNVFNSKTIILKEVTKRFENTNLLGTNTLSSSTEVISLVVDKVSSYSLGSEISQTNGKQAIILSVTNGRIRLASNTFVNNEPVIFSSAFSGIETNKIYYVVDSDPTSFKISLTENGTAILLSDTSNPGSVVLNQKALGVVLETTEEKNTCKVRVLRGSFIVSSNYFLKTNNLNDTVGSKIVQKIR